MITFLYSKTVRKILLAIIALSGASSFYFAGSPLVLLLFVGILMTFSLINIFADKSAIFTLIYLSFSAAFGFYFLFFRFGLPLWLLMLGIGIVFSYLFASTEQKIGILGNKRLIYVILFSLIILEVFLSLSYFSINPVSQSLVIAAVCYLFVGFCYTVLAKHLDNRFTTYIIITGLVFLLVFTTIDWTGLV